MSKYILFSESHILFSMLQVHYNKLSEEEKQILEALMNDEGQIPSNIGIMNYDYWEKWLKMAQISLICCPYHFDSIEYCLCYL